MEAKGKKKRGAKNEINRPKYFSTWKLLNNWESSKQLHCIQSSDWGGRWSSFTRNHDFSKMELSQSDVSQQEMPPPSSLFAPRGLPWDGVFAKPEKNVYINLCVYVSVSLHAQPSGGLRWFFCCCSFPGLTNVPLSSKGDVFCRSSFEKGVTSGGNKCLKTEACQSQPWRASSRLDTRRIVIAVSPPYRNRLTGAVCI